jgi:hypothetical protein
MTAPISDTEVPAFWQSLGLPGIADIHVHFLPPRMLARVWEHFDNLGRRSGESSDNLGRRSGQSSDNLGRRSGQPSDNLGTADGAGPAGDGPLVAPVWPIIYRWSDEDRVAHPAWSSARETSNGTSSVAGRGDRGIRRNGTSRTR